MLTTSRQMLIHALEKGYAVPAVNTQGGIMILSGPYVKRLRVAKINFGTEIRYEYAERYEEALKTLVYQVHSRTLSQYANEKLQEDVRKIILLAGSEGRKQCSCRGKKMYLQNTASALSQNSRVPDCFRGKSYQGFTAPQ